MEVFPCPSEIGVESFRQHHSPRRTRIGSTDQIKAQGSLNEKGILPREGKRSITPILARDGNPAARQGTSAHEISAPFVRSPSVSSRAARSMKGGSSRRTLLFGLMKIGFMPKRGCSIRSRSSRKVRFLLYRTVGTRSKRMHWMDARALRRKDAFRGERPWGDTVCDPWISDRETVSKLRG
ncbi:hypothetical protein V6N13_075667 [Hibiscus sabdariffa]